VKKGSDYRVVLELGPVYLHGPLEPDPASLHGSGPALEPDLVGLHGARRILELALADLKGFFAQAKSLIR
jgi:hypothetical protein